MAKVSNTSRRRWLKRLALVALMLAAAGTGLAFALARWAAVELADHQAEIDHLRERSIASNRAARSLLVRDRFELELLFSTRLLLAAAEQLEGYDQLTRKGNRFTIHKLDVELHDGWAELLAHATFDWRWGLYDGPIAVRYMAFAAIDPDGSCSLHFRVAEVETLGHAPLFRGWLVPTLTLRMQNQLKLPKIQLPLSIGQEPGDRQPGARERAGGASGDRRSADRGFALDYQPRGWQLGAQNPQLLLDREAFGLVVERVDPTLPNSMGSSVALAPDGFPAPSLLGDSDVLIGMRFDRLAALLERVFAPADEVGLTIERLVVPMAKASSRVAGVEFARTLALRDVRGTVDVGLSQLLLGGGGVTATASFRGRFAGIVEGTAYGVDFAIPIKVRPTLEETLPLRFVGDEGELGIFPEARAITLDLDVEATVAGRSIAFDYPLELAAGELLRPIRLRDMTNQALAVPTRVERGVVVEARPLDLAISWQFELPARPEEFVRVRGKLAVAPASQVTIRGVESQSSPTNSPTIDNRQSASPP